MSVCSFSRGSRSTFTTLLRLGSGQVEQLQLKLSRPGRSSTRYSPLTRKPASAAAARWPARAGLPAGTVRAGHGRRYRTRLPRRGYGPGHRQGWPWPPLPREAALAVATAALQLGQLAERRGDPGLLPAEVDNHRNVVLHADNPAEAVAVVSYLVVHVIVLDRRSRRGIVERTSWQIAPGHGAGWAHDLQYAP